MIPHVFPPEGPVDRMTDAIAPGVGRESSLEVEESPVPSAEYTTCPGMAGPCSALPGSWDPGDTKPHRPAKDP